MSFTPSTPGTGTDHSELLDVIIANSITLQQGEAVSFNSNGFATNLLTQTKVCGIVVGFADSYGKPLTPTAYSAGTATGSDVLSVAAASNNQTVAKTVAIVETSQSKRWSVQVNGTIGTTVHSDQPGYFIDIDSANTNYGRVLETTATRTAASADQFAGWGTDPADSTRLIVSIANSFRNNN